MEIGKKIKKFREYKNFSQAEVAFNAGINEKYYGKIERGESYPTINVLCKICSALDISIVSLFIYEINLSRKQQVFSPKMSDIISKGLKTGFTIHFNIDLIYAECESSVWYNGYVGSICLDEYELKLYAVGNIKGQLYRNYQLIEEFNSADIANKIRRYINSDSELYSQIAYMGYDEDVLLSKNGNALFITESNWLTATIYNSLTNKIMHSDIILDTDNIIDALGNTNLLIEYIFYK